MTFMHDNREAFDIPEKNLAFFPNPGTLGFMDPYKPMRTFAVEAGCQYPKAITSSKMRHNITTSVQITTLELPDMKWMADHLGHTLGKGSLLNFHILYFRE
jgi:hypothetical protein